MRNKREMAIVKDNLDMNSIVSRMTDTGFGVAVLVDQKGVLSGVITDGDLRRNINEIPTSLPKEIATSKPISVKPNDLVSVALEKMEKSRVYAIVVIEGDQPVVSCVLHDILRSGIK